MAGIFTSNEQIFCDNLQQAISSALNNHLGTIIKNALRLEGEEAAKAVNDAVMDEAEELSTVLAKDICKAIHGFCCNMQITGQIHTTGNRMFQDATIDAQCIPIDYTRGMSGPVGWNRLKITPK